MPVALKGPNEWGTHDMLGNVMEWIDYVYTGLGLEYGEGIEGPLVDPIGSTEDKDARRGLRGGSFLTEPCNAKSSMDQPESNSQRIVHLGFRPVRTIFPDIPDGGMDGGK
jgi:formylglycine-generating enzyme required for sulfatase activity